MKFYQLMTIITLASCSFTEHEEKTNIRPEKKIPHADSLITSITSNDIADICKPDTGIANSMLIRIYPEAREWEDIETYRLRKTVYYVNMDEDIEKEYVVYFNNDTTRPFSSFASFVYVLDFQNSRYVNAGGIIYCCERVSRYTIPPLDTFHKIITSFGRMWGTCEGGEYMTGYKLLNGRLISVIDWAVCHSGNSCESFTDEDTKKIDFEYASAIKAKNEWTNDSTMVLTCWLNRNKYGINKKGSIVFDKSIYRNKKIVLTYKLNRDTGKFDCYTQKGDLLEEHPVSAGRFVMLAEGKKFEPVLNYF